MLTDITLGQYYPGSSVIHGLDPRAKILATLLFIAAIFFAESMLSYGVLALFVAAVILLSRLPVLMVLRSVKPLWIIILLTLFIHAFTGEGSNVAAPGIFAAYFVYFNFHDLAYCADGWY